MDAGRCGQSNRWGKNDGYRTTNQSDPFAGCILDEQVATQLYTAIFYVLLDLTLLSLYLYYETVRLMLIC